jgi:hypothetical protein
VVHFPMLMFHLKKHVSMWRNRKTCLKWYNVALLLAHKDFLHILVFHKHVCSENYVMMTCTHFTHSMVMACTHFTNSVCKSTLRGQCHASRILSMVSYLSLIASINTVHWWTYFHL